ncbi:hypothetical protein ACP70R_004971 [Stipagrostis hirtigluma subsp. patula]
MENLTLPAPMGGAGAASHSSEMPGGAAASPSGAGVSAPVSAPSSSHGATPAATAPRKRTPGRWRRIPRATAPATTPPPPAVQAKAPFFDFQLKPAPACAPEEMARRVPPPFMAPPTVTVLTRGSRAAEEAMRRGNRKMLEQAKRLEEDDEELCDTEEAKVAFRAFKVKFAAFYRSMATEDVVFKHKPRSNNEY